MPHSSAPYLPLLDNPRWSKRQRKLAHKQFDRFARFFEAGYQTQARNQLNLERDELVRIARITLREDASLTAPAVVSKSKRERKRARRLGQKMITEESLRAFSASVDKAYAKYVKEWTTRFTRLHNETAVVVGGRLKGELGIGFNVFDPNIQSVLVNHASRLADQVTDTSWRAIMSTTFTGMQRGEGIDQIAARIQRAYNKGLTIVDKNGRTRVLGARARSRLIARTETTTITNAASLAGVKNDPAGVLLYLKGWLSQGDDRVRQLHLDEEDGDPIPLEDDFPVTGLDSPGDPNCRCSLLYTQRKKKLSNRRPPKVTEARAKTIQAKLAEKAAKAERLKKKFSTERSRLNTLLDATTDAVARRAVGRQIIRLNDRGRTINRRLLSANTDVLRRTPKYRSIVKVSGTVGKNSQAGVDWFRQVVDSRVLSIFPGQANPIPRNIAFAQRKGVRAFYNLGEITVRAQDQAWVTIHELGHAIEDFHTKTLSAAKKLLNSRRKNVPVTRGPFAGTTQLEPAVQLAKLSDGEIGWKDNFYDRYVGKFYRNGSEITSMGLEAMWKDPIAFAKADFEHFWYTLRVMNGDFI